MAQGTGEEAFGEAIDAAGGATRGGRRVTTAATAPEQPAWFAWTFRIAVTAMKEIRHDG